ncbi:hypothetical protein N7478_003385 [Penicillium angulare]|uniref:uncharacterized protein n=1 Tax=Penicillium angulare TaxID=116970 RepID=UPI0025420990|nr:uncharacterized protein N7478_003385 [Penicillium angulare]KAJ5287699.1 hypothetical protein N7478_003385 [Penicillium angulare]
MRQSVQGPPVGYFTPPSGPMATRSPQASAAQQTGPQSAASSAFRPGQTQMGGGPLQDSTVQVRNQAAASPHHQLAPPHHVPSPASLTPQTHLTYPVNYPYLMPPEGYRIPQLAVPDPFRLSMHQIDLLDPIKKCVKSGEPGGHKVEAELFHYFSDFWLGPTEIDPHAYNYEWPLTLTAEDIRRLPRYETLAKEEHRKVITYQTGCRVFRLRCVAIKKIETRDIRDLWPTAPTTWPSCFYIHINGIELTARRKPHNARDLPVDLSMSLKDGENKLQISLLPRDGEFENTRFFFAVEKMEIHSFEMVRGQVQTVPAEKVRQIIRERLNKTAADEDLAVVTENLNVSLIDPFTAQVFTHPARSELCTHLDCFDLETFIRTRKSVSGPASLNDKWTCPICNVDARPQLLKVDRFFEEVRDELVSKNQLEVAQAIKISSNGSWTLQTIQESTPERRSSSQTPLAKRKAGSQRAGSATSRPKIESSSTRTAPSSERVVIELD